MQIKKGPSPICDALRLRDNQRCTATAIQVRLADIHILTVNIISYNTPLATLLPRLCLIFQAVEGMANLGKFNTTTVYLNLCLKAIVGIPITMGAGKTGCVKICGT